mgnify:CR=1 FL=1
MCCATVSSWVQPWPPSCGHSARVPLILVLALQVPDGDWTIPCNRRAFGQIVLNLSPDATGQLQMANDFISFQARFGGAAHSLVIPVANVVAIYARENGQGMAFPVPTPQEADDGQEAATPAGAERKSGIRLASVPDSEPVESVALEASSQDEAGPEPEPPSAPSGGGRPSLRRVK